MVAAFQNIKTKRSGLRCAIRVMNHSGDDVLTTYDTMVDSSVEVATKDLQDFWQKCIDEFADRGTTKLKPVVCGRKVGAIDFDWLGESVMAPDFDLGRFEEILIQPVPLVGG